MPIEVNTGNTYRKPRQLTRPEYQLLAIVTWTIYGQCCGRVVVIDRSRHASFPEAAGRQLDAALP
jgi:hypothetical protein